MTDVFKSFPFTPPAYPTKDYHVCNKKYCDDWQENNIQYDDQQVVVSGVRLPAVNTPSWTAYKGGEVLTFDGTQTNLVYFNAQLSHSYQEGTNLSFHIHYVCPNNTSANSRWVFTYSWASINGTYPGATTTTTILATPVAADKHTLGIIDSAIVGTSQTISSVLLCSLQRTGGHADDTYNSNIYLIAMDFHMAMDSLGSSTVGVK